MSSSKPTVLILCNAMNYCVCCYIDLTISGANFLSQKAPKLWWGILLWVRGKGKEEYNIENINNLVEKYYMSWSWLINKRSQEAARSHISLQTEGEFHLQKQAQMGTIDTIPFKWLKNRNKTQTPYLDHI